ncbi:DUF4998 domain-containing protein [Bacteroides sp. 224]|uniref:DUF4998 domain-containing protein n=1 Tax=Bacteroides sp. 224 TaxID=2302936 RepID=UPI0013D8DD73|nr:DUF4998 domain-containing protein [Bacteroides sp. 224]NDV65282.1 DUF5013 domain-containing protein [Bacteroides sp. 224]
MKKIHWIIISALLYMSYSCSDMLDNIDGFLKEGETIHVGKLDLLQAYSGKNRIKIEGQMIYGVNQVKCVINWIDPVTLEKDSKEFPIVREKAGETFEFMLDNLKEGQYDFSIVTYDPEGNQSIPNAVSAYAYGNQYAETLTGRIIRSITPEERMGKNNEREWITQINWNISRGDGIIGCNLEYEQEDGAFKTLYIPVDDTSTQLENFKSGGIMRYNTEYMPEETALDIFTTTKEEVTLPEKNYVGVTKDLTGVYIKNAGYPFTGSEVSNNWGLLDHWSWNDVIRNQNGAGGAGFATYGGGIVQFETTRWDQGTYENGKLWQTITLPKGKYEMRIEVANCHQGDHTIHFAVMEGNELPDNSYLPNAALSCYEFDNGHVNITMPTFELDKQTTITIGWVVSFFELRKNIEFKSIRLWSVAE